MRIAIVVAPKIGAVHGMIGHALNLEQQIIDRISDHIGFPGEQVIRLPRRFNHVVRLPRFCGRTTIV